SSTTPLPTIAHGRRSSHFYPRCYADLMTNKKTAKTNALAPTVTQQQAEEAIRTLLRWAGEDPTREGLRDTPKRVVRAYRDWFSGSLNDPADYLRRTFVEVEGYDELIVLRHIASVTHCELHSETYCSRA